ncbi:MAG TPA: signal peptidase I [Streptosporangiaceae bacterium]|nr:signal peptidase I [Streptosporangiaceae bacterium]
MSGTIYTGSAPKDTHDNRGWLLGHFMPAGDIRHSTDVEIKWGVHARGDRRAQWVTGEIRTAVIVLVSGRFRIEFPEQSVVLAERGDYVVFKGVDHSWFAEEESVIVGIRWPSVPGYAVPYQADEVGG